MLIKQTMDLTEMNYKDIPGYEGLYKVSTHGIVISSQKNWNIKNGYRSNGYNYQTLYKNGKKRNYRVSQLIAMAYLNHNPCGFKLVVDHINNNKLDDRLENLQLLSNRSNCSKDRRRKYSKYTGVTFANSRWRAVIQIDGLSVYLGKYETEEEAKMAYINKLEEIGHNNKLK